MKLGQIASVIVAIACWMSPACAQDPFRDTNPKPIGDHTEAAFKAMFVDGDYRSATNLVQQAQSSEPNEPLNYALQASLAYMQGDISSLAQYANQTLATATQLNANDPLRSNLYIAVGHALEAGYLITKDGTVKGVPEALSKLNEVFDSLDVASGLILKIQS